MVKYFSFVIQVPQGWVSTSLEENGVPQTEQKGGSIQRIPAKQSAQIPFLPPSRNLSQQWHREGKKNWKNVSIKETIKSENGPVAKSHERATEGPVHPL